MAKTKPKMTSDRQWELFEALNEPAVIGNSNATDLDIHFELMGACHEALKHARSLGYGRERVVERMNQALPERKKPITLRQLNSWMAESREYHDLPARVLAAFCWATQSDLPLRVAPGACGFGLVDAREDAARQLGEHQIQIARLKREVSELTKTLRGE